MGFNDDDGAAGETVLVIDSTAQLDRLSQSSNVNVAGTWIFQVDSNIAVQGCELSTSSARALPLFGPIQGGTRIEISNLPRCLNLTTDFASVEFAFPFGEIRSYKAVVAATDRIVVLAPPTQTASSVRLTVRVNDTILGVSETFSLPEPYFYYADIPALQVEDISDDAVRLTWQANPLRPHTAIFVERYSQDAQSMDHHQMVLAGVVTSSSSVTSSVDLARNAAITILGSVGDSHILTYSIAQSATPFVEPANPPRSDNFISSPINAVVQAITAVVESGQNMMQRIQNSALTRYASGRMDRQLNRSSEDKARRCSEWHSREVADMEWLDDLVGRQL
jgi:hypothetical protein